MEPAITVDAEGLSSILLKLGRAMDGLKQRQKAWQAVESRCPPASTGTRRFT
jgi:hypothetical protein